MRSSTLMLFILAITACDPRRGGSDAAIPPQETECADGIDNDRDGLIDGEDPDCDVGEDVESTLALCRNGIDDDGDSQVDCQDRGCLAAGHCEAFEMETCTVFNASQESGCPIGMACYLVAGRAQCRLPGERTERQPCRMAGYAAADRHDCARDYLCVNYDPSSGDQGICLRLCLDTVQPVCEAFSFCSADPGTLGTCWGVCDPRPGVASGCPSAGWRCVSGHELGAIASSYAEGGAFSQCANETYGVVGQADGGQACADPPNAATPLSQVCRSGFACIPAALTDAFEPTCRVTCNATANQGCAAGETCRPLYDGVSVPAFGYMGIEIGFCAP